MGFDALVLGDWCVLRWRAYDEKSIREALVLAREARHRAGRPLVYAGLQFDDCADPDPASRKAAMALSPELQRLCRRYYVGVCTTGVRATLTRSILRAMSAAMRLARSNISVEVVGSVEELLEREAAALPCPEAELRQRMLEQRILAPTPPAR